VVPALRAIKLGTSAASIFTKQRNVSKRAESPEGMSKTIIRHPTQGQGIETRSTEIRSEVAAATKTLRKENNKLKGEVEMYENTISAFKNILVTLDENDKSEDKKCSRWILNKIRKLTEDEKNKLNGRIDALDDISSQE
jgi:DNA replicative helicase MCM subunit Mcm2 (Cdc46/Mcm family)